MVDIIEKSISAGELPPSLRGDIEPDAQVLVSVRRLTANGFTPEFEEQILESERGPATEPMEAADMIGLLRKLANEDQRH